MTVTNQSGATSPKNNFSSRHQSVPCAEIKEVECEFDGGAVGLKRSGSEYKQTNGIVGSSPRGDDTTVYYSVAQTSSNADVERSFNSQRKPDPSQSLVILTEQGKRSMGRKLIGMEPVSVLNDDSFQTESIEVTTPKLVNSEE